jgi:hypothetical protein
VEVKGFFGRVILLILTQITWTYNKTIPLVRISYKEEITEAINELARDPVTVHPLPVHLHYYISTSKTKEEYSGPNVIIAKLRNYALNLNVSF